MKGDTVLDYVEFQLTPPRTRCELFVSADGVTEKLASGFLKPFLTHLRAVEEQIARGCESVKLEHPQISKDYHGRSWFTKGTLERFVRFVSTPEVLERVKSVEDELAQLEQVRSIQASSLLQVDDIFLGADSAFSNTDGKSNSGLLEKNGSSKLPRRYPYDAVNSGAEASKVELLRAMDVRLLALRQEQNVAFSRAAAAGFNSGNMSDLMAFSEHFGAERLRAACLNFLAVFQKRRAESTELDSEATSSGSGMSLSSATGVEVMIEREVSSQMNVRLSQGTQIDMQKGSALEDGRTLKIDDRLTFALDKGTDFDSSLSKGPGGMEARKRWGPPENIRPKLFVDHNETDSASSNDTSNRNPVNDSPDTSNRIPVNDSPDVQSFPRKSQIANVEQGRGHDDLPLGSLDNAAAGSELNISENPVQDNGLAKTMSGDYIHSNLEQSSEAQANLNGGASQRSSSPKRRSSSPLRRVQIGRSGPCRSGTVVVSNISYFPSQEPSNKEKNSTVEPSSSDSEDHTNDDNAMESAPLPTPVSAPARRLSVQDAISLFENKQRRDSIDGPGKQRPCKQDSGKVSLEGANASSSGSMAPRRWSAVSGIEAGNNLQENQTSSKQDAGVSSTERLLDEAASTSVSLTSMDPSNLSQARQGRPAAEPHSGAFIKFSGTARWQPSAQSATAKPETEPGKQSSYHQEQVSIDSASKALEGDWRKQFKLQLEKSLAKESFTRDLPVKAGPQKSESNISMPKKTTNFSNFETLRSNDTGLSSANSGIFESRSREPIEKGGFSTGSTQPLPMQDSSVIKTPTVAYVDFNQGQSGLDNSESFTSSPKKREATVIKEACGKDEIAKLFVDPKSASNQSSGRESLGSSSVNPSDHDMQALVKMVDNQTIDDDNDPNGLKGRFYEQYRKLRDAKLMEEQDSKRAEREAKLRTMEETLTRRKAEMDARAARLSKNIHNQARATKLQALKADLYTAKKEQEDGDEVFRLISRDQRNSDVTSTSPPLTPLASKEEATTSKPQGVRKAVAISQKGATPPRSSSRATPSVSPKLTPRSTTGATANQRRSVVSSATDNPLARSVPCFANLRKENTKPSPGRPSGSARVHPKNGGPGRPRAVNEATPLEANVNVSVRAAHPHSGPAKQDKKLRSTLMRKSCATASDFKMLSTSSDDGVLAPLKGQREIGAEPAAYNKLRRSAVGPFQEAKPFLRKGRGIGPGAGPGVIKQKASSAVDTVKSSDEEEAPTMQMVEPNVTDGENQVIEEVHDAGHLQDISEVENMDTEVANEADAPVESGPNYMEMQVTATVDTSPEELEEKLEIATADASPEEPFPEDPFDTERACHTISFPIDIETHKRYAADFGMDLDSNPILDMEALNLRQEDSEPLSQLVEHTTESLQSQFVAAASTSFRASSLPHEHILPVFSPVPASPPSSSVVRPGTVFDHVSPSSAATQESPLGSPASWNSSQIQYASGADANQLNKKWVGSQKPAMAMQPKEPAKGFKRLLKFARKSRASEVVTADYVSASTTSEGDDESEEQSRSADEVSSRGRLQERRMNDAAVDQYNMQDQGSAQRVRSSIPIPPANFRLRDDHLTGGTMLKAPRSFFSLSSFRSKASEGKSRY